MNNDNRFIFSLTGGIALVIGWLAAGVVAAESTRKPPTTAPAPATRPVQESWVGVYSSPSEIGGFSGTVVAIENGIMGGLKYRMTFYSDVEMTEAIEEKVKTGDVLVDADRMYMAIAHGVKMDNRILLLGHLQRYTRMTIQGKKVLMRDDALKAYKEQNKLYDYGILIRVDDQMSGLDLEKVKGWGF